MKRLVILGAGGFGRTVADLAGQLGVFNEILFLDDGQCGGNIVGKCMDYRSFADSETAFYPAFGNNESRLNWLDRLESEGCKVATLIHSSAYVSASAVIGTGTVVMPKAGINTNCRIGRGCIINLGAIIDHGCAIEDGVHICLGAIVKAENRIPANMKVEAGEVINNRTYPV